MKTYYDLTVWNKTINMAVAANDSPSMRPEWERHGAFPTYISGSCKTNKTQGMSGEILCSTLLSGLFLIISHTALAAPVVGDVSWEKHGNDHMTLVDITFSFTHSDNTECWVALWGHDEITRQHFPMNQFLEGDIKNRRFAPGTHTVTWIASLDGAGRTSDHFQVFARVSDEGRVAAGRYLVIDVSGGPSATSYPVFYLDNLIETPEAALNVAADHFVVTRDQCRTDYIVLRELPDGSYAGIYEVTQRQYQLVTGETPSDFSGNPMRPVENVSWNTITGSGNYTSGFIYLIRERTGLLGLGLPLGDAWVHACQAGATNDYNDYTLNNGLGAVYGGSSSDPVLNNLGWYTSNSGSRTHDAGGKQPNAWGLYETHGNIREWCINRHGGVNTGRMAKGGDWNHSASDCRSADAVYPPAENAMNTRGFRLFCDITPR